MAHILVTFKSYFQISCGGVFIQSPFKRNMNVSFEALKIIVIGIFKEPV